MDRAKGSRENSARLFLCLGHLGQLRCDTIWSGDIIWSLNCNSLGGRFILWASFVTIRNRVLKSWAPEFCGGPTIKESLLASKYLVEPFIAGAQLSKKDSLIPLVLQKLTLAISAANPLLHNGEEESWELEVRTYFGKR